MILGHFWQPSWKSKVECLTQMPDLFGHGEQGKARLSIFAYVEIKG